MIAAPVEDPPLYVILREQEEYGPFCKETLREALEMGNLVLDDWVRKVDRSSCWTSVGKVLYGPPEPVALGVKFRRVLRLGMIELERAVKWSATVINHELDGCATQLVDRARALTWISMVVATAIMFLPDRPLFVAVPWILAGTAAGIALMIREGSVRAFILCLAATIVPVATDRGISAVTHYFDPNRREVALPPIGEEVQSTPRKSSELIRTRSRAKSGIPALGLPQPTEDGK